jgi:c-di-GMP-binding flagellar brake protein YcgR
LQKPISPLNASRCFNAALNFMVRERRRYHRHPVKMLVKVVVGDKEIKATSTDISEGGIALFLHQALPKDATPRLLFTLPDSTVSMEIETEVAWADLKGAVGLRFRNVPSSSQVLLDKWLNERAPKQVAGVKASTPDVIQ